MDVLHGYTTWIHYMNVLHDVLYVHHWQMINFLETGTIRNSVNFPPASLARQDENHTRLCVINQNRYDGLMSGKPNQTKPNLT